jgi:hypothetical protein
MDVDQGPVWSFDKRICSVSHGNRCTECKSFRKHVFDALFDEDASLEKAMKNAHHDAEEFADLEKEVDYLRERLEDRASELRAIKRDYDDLLGTNEVMRDEIASLETRVYELGGTTPRDDDRERHRAKRGKARAQEPADATSSVEPRVRTLSLNDKNDARVVEPAASASASGWSMGKADSFATVAGRLPPSTGMAPAVFQRRPVVKNPRSALAVALKGGDPLSLEQVQELCKRAHTGGPNGGPDVSAISRVRFLATAAHAVRQGGGALTPVQDWLLKNWRVPDGVEKSGERVARHLGLAPRAAPQAALTAKGGIPPPPFPPTPIDHKTQLTMRVSDAKTRLNASPNAYFGLKAEGTALPVATRLLEIAVAISYLGPDKARHRRQFMALAVTLLLSKGAYPALLQRVRVPLPPRTHKAFGPPKVAITVEAVADALYTRGVTVEEAASWDDYVVAWGKDYLLQPNLPADDDVRVAMQERTTAPKDFAILQCISMDGRPSRLPRVVSGILTYADAPAIVPEGYCPEDGEYMDDEEDIGGPIVGPIPPQPE